MKKGLFHSLIAGVAIGAAAFTFVPGPADAAGKAPNASVAPRIAAMATPLSARVAARPDRPKASLAMIHVPPSSNDTGEAPSLA